MAKFKKKKKRGATRNTKALVDAGSDSLALADDDDDVRWTLRPQPSHSPGLSDSTLLLPVHLTCRPLPEHRVLMFPCDLCSAILAATKEEQHFRQRSSGIRSVSPSTKGAAWLLTDVVPLRSHAAR